MNTFKLEFITPLFSRGEYEDRVEVRPPSIRGQLHWWFRALGGNAADEKAIFGSVHDGATASKVVVRVSEVNGTVTRLNTLPHKSGDQASPKAACAPGLTCKLHILSRLGGLTGKHRDQFNRTLEVWLLLGTLGFRGTRAAGSFMWTDDGDCGFTPADTFERYERRCRELLKVAPLKFALLDNVYDTTEEARRVVSDTLGGKGDQHGKRDLDRLHDPLGKIFGGRKTSPLRFRLVRFGGKFRIAAIWDARMQVTGNSPSDLAGIIKLLAECKPALGKQLAASKLADNP